MPLVHTFRNVFGSPKTFRILANCFYFARSFCFCYYPSNYELNVVTFSSSFRHFVLLCFRDLPVNRFNFNFLLLILTHCTQFQLFALNFNFLHSISTFSAVSGFIYVFSANERAEIFAYILSRETNALQNGRKEIETLIEICEKKQKKGKGKLETL